MASTEWHNSDTLLRAVQGFHERYARQPTQEIDRARRIHTAYMGEVESKFRDLGILVRIEYTGSTYEGTKVAKGPGNLDLEFDVMVIIPLRGGVQLQVERIPSKPGFSRLKLQGAVPATSNIFGQFEGNYLHPQRTAAKFFGELQKCINNSDSMKNNVKLRGHGPAAQMDVDCRDEYGRLLYSVDVVPTYEVNGERYVAKPITNEAMPEPLAWRRSFSLEEKNRLLGADGDNGCRKKILRILKVLKNREPGLAPLTSYHLKTALFLEMDEPGINWNEVNLGRRLMGVLGQLKRRLDAGNLPHYFLHGSVNLLSSMSGIALSNLGSRVGRLRSSEVEMMRILNS